MNPDPAEEERILIVASSEVDRTLLGETGSASGGAVLAAASLTEVARPIGRCPQAIVIAVEPERVVASVSLARRVYGSVFIVAVGNLPMTVAFAVARAGADALVPKPTTSDDLLAIIRGASGRPSPPRQLASLARAEWEYIQAVVELCGGNRSEAARQLGIYRSVLQRKLSRTAPRR